ncbi:MAG: peptidase M22 [Oscillospiraceae bacterium]|nr:peptidase M22 [Oscillospiraceae bacterium]
MMYLGIDTSNYTTSAALYNSGTGEVLQAARLLPVKEGQLGLRQSDAVFAHVKALGGILEGLFAAQHKIAAVGVSATPCDAKGSYMPCFLAGEMAARSIGAAMGIPVHLFSHQRGHIAAALYGAGRMDLAEKPFLAFHISGGTTECLAVEPDKALILRVLPLARSLDLHAGQAVDRVGAMLGIRFPAGPGLEALAEKSDKTYRPKPKLKGMDCCLSGLENMCAKMISSGESPQDTARFCLDYLAHTVYEMARLAADRYPGREIVFAGGVMSNRIIRGFLERSFNCVFAPPRFSADNAAGVAWLAARSAAGFRI